MKKEQSMKSNTNPSSNKGPRINDPKVAQPFLDALSEASRDFPEPLMTKEEIDAAIAESR